MEIWWVWEGDSRAVFLGGQHEALDQQDDWVAIQGSPPEVEQKGKQTRELCIVRGYVHFACVNFQLSSPIGWDTC